MGVQIVGANGVPIGGDSRGNLFSRAVDRSEEADWNGYGHLFVAHVSNTPTGAADVYAHLANTDTNGRSLEIISLEFNAAAAETVKVYLGPDTAIVGGTSTAVAALNPASGFSPAVDYNIGVDITVFDATASTRVVGLVAVDVAKGVGVWTPKGRVIVPPGWALWLSEITGAIAQVSLLTFGVPLKDTETR